MLPRNVSPARPPMPSVRPAPSPSSSMVLANRREAGAAQQAAPAITRPANSAIAANRRVMGYKKGGSTGSASSRADGIAQRGKTKGRMC